MSRYTRIWDDGKTKIKKEVTVMINNRTGQAWKPYKGTSTPKEKIGRIGR